MAQNNPTPFLLRYVGGQVVILELWGIVILETDEKMRSLRGKAPLRMTPAVSDEILTDSKYESSG